MKRKYTLLLTSVSLLAATYTQAQTAFFDFGRSDGENKSLIQAGTTGFEAPYNAVAGVNELSVTSSSGITLTLYDDAAFIGRNRWNYSPTPGSDLTWDETFIDFIGGIDKIKVSGLAANTEYSFQFIAFDDDSSSSRTISFAETTGGANNALGSVTYNAGDQVNSNSDFSVFSNLTSNASGDIYVDLTSSSGTPLLSGLIIIPEPQTSALLIGSLTGLSALAFRRKRTTN
ncbi:hypothetical protein QEH59_03690 [Coraliomargarita sp. SDUM461004]|uniref:PEP-CTERM protein-sorting domain-containing protein n=1 Tax=Thalassobacterium sedimentorum TaxID=3041258 RepID=A0ABU1AFE1_9BACT|nr:hypothetical protein [Coraliomargarita sp. SDUM461004]MDQ8193512.1 hypothetical protein [Coraliomargarita sp. SDUM461004]